MKAISLFKFLTLVTGMLFSFSVQAAPNLVSGVTSSTNCSAQCIQLNPATGASLDITASDNRSICTSTCEAQKSDLTAKGTECKSLNEAYLKNVTDALNACSRAGTSSISECQSKAAQCASGSDTFAADSGSEFGSSLTTVLTSMVGAQTGTDNSNSCYETYTNTDAEDSAAQRIDDKIARLREQITSDKNKQVDEDDKLSKKKNEVEEKMQDAQAEVDKKKFERQTKNQNEATRVGKLVIESEKKRRKNATTIDDKTTQIANLAFAQQEINLKFADSKIATTCNDRLEALKAKITKTDPKTGKKGKTKFTAAQASQIKKQLESDNASCYAEQNLAKQAQVKGIMDTKRKLQAEIDTLTAENQDEAKSIALEQQNVEQLKTIASSEEANDIAALQKKLTTLNKSVTDLETSVLARKKNLDESIANRNKQIDQLIADSKKVKNKYQAVSSSVQQSNSSASAFLDACCGSNGKSTVDSKFDSACSTAKNTSGAAARSQARSGIGTSQ